MGRLCNSRLCTGTRGCGQITLENYDLITRLITQAEPGDINFANPVVNNFSKYINNRLDKDVEGNLDFVAHGSSKTVKIFNHGKEYEVDWREIAKIIKVNKNYYQGKPIKLLSCYTGKNADGFAQNLANKLNTIVYAPKTIIWARPDGSYYIADKRDALKSEYQEFEKFVPRGKKK